MDSKSLSSTTAEAVETVSSPQPDHDETLLLLRSLQLPDLSFMLSSVLRAPAMSKLDHGIGTMDKAVVGVVINGNSLESAEGKVDDDFGFEW